MIRTAILTISDSAFAGTREDLSGPALKSRCAEAGWRIAADRTVPDEPAGISQQILRWTDEEAIDLVLTTGGTGISPRDNTPEATRSVLERELPGLGELMRSKGMEQTPYSVLSRGLAGTRGRTLIVNLPGSPKGALYSLGVIEPFVAHIVKLLNGHTEH